jgi:hypothetical protein
VGLRRVDFIGTPAFAFQSELKALLIVVAGYRLLTYAPSPSVSHSTDSAIRSEK